MVKSREFVSLTLVHDPKILILDESAAVLNAQLKRVVHEALEKVSTGRTTITIAHKLIQFMNDSYRSKILTSFQSSTKKLLLKAKSMWTY